MSQPSPDGSNAGSAAEARSGAGESALPADAGGQHGGYLGARDALERAERARARGDLDTARAETDRAIATLGKDYAPPGVVDDTGMKLAAADELWEQGRRDAAISTQVRMLRSRLALYATRYPDAPREPRALKLELRVDQARSPKNQGLKLAAKLTNVGTAPVLVNSRLALNSAHAPDPMRELVVDLHGPDGELRPFLLKLKIGAPEGKHVQSLAPGQSLEKQYDLDTHFDLSTPGDYRAGALYSSAPVADANGNPVWTELVYSHDVRFMREP